MKLPAIIRRRGNSGLTLLLWTPHPAQRDVTQALEALSAKSRQAPIVLTESGVRRIDPAHLREQYAKAGAAQRPLLVQAPLLPEVRLAPFTKRHATEVSGLLEQANIRKARVVLVLTPHDRLFENIYIKQAETGATTATFADFFKKADEVDLSYATMVKRLRQVPSVQSVQVVSWDLAEENLSPLLNAVLAPIAQVRDGALKEFDRPPKLRGYASRRGIRVARAMHKFIDDRHEHALVRTFVRENFRARKLSDTVYLSDEDRQQLQKRYRGEARLLGQPRQG